MGDLHFLTRLENELDAAETLELEETVEERSKTVLIVDDNKESLELYKLILERENYQVFGAISGDEAHNCCQEHDIGLVFMDLSLPGESGVDIGREIKKRYEIPILALTASPPQDKYRKMCFEAGFDEFKSKPISMDDLIRTVQQYLG